MITLFSWFVTPALALDYELCVRYRTDLLDATSIAGDDKWTNNAATKSARGILIGVEEVGGAPVSIGFADNTGCVVADLTPFTEYHLVIWSHTSQVGRDIEVRDALGGDLFEITTANTFYPLVGGTRTYTIDAATPGLEWANALGVASYAVYRNLGAWPVDTFTIVVESGTGTFYSPVEQVVYIDPVDAGFSLQRKYIIAHELGHDLFHRANTPIGGNPGLFQYLLDYDAFHDSKCEAVGVGATASHGYVSKEYHAAAVIEGHAHYVAAATFNLSSEDDCRVVPNQLIDWNQDDNLDNPDAFSCEGYDGAGEADPGAEDLYGVDAYDYTGEFCLTPDLGLPLPIPIPAVANRSTELDWLRFFWDIDTEHGLSFGTILYDVLVGADPHTWAANDGGAAGTFPDEVIKTQLDLIDPGIWTAEGALNGVDR